MKVTTVSSSQLVGENRWDVGFHLLLNEHKERIEELRERFTAEEATELLERIQTSDLKPILDLSRQQNPQLTKATAKTVIGEYPHLALAIIESHFEGLKAKADEEVAARQAYADILNDFSATLTAPRP